MKRTITIIAIILTVFTLKVMGNVGVSKSASSSIKVRVIFPHMLNKSLYYMPHTTKELYKQTVIEQDKIKKDYIYIISRSGKKLTFKLDTDINLNNIPEVINSIKDTLAPGDYIATCRINSTPISYRFRIPS